MACCRICCGCQTCAEGQEGKCCCGGAAGNCCQPGEYCCEGTCENQPCGGCDATCSITPEVVWYANLTGTYLQHDGDSYPACESGADIPERITGTFTLGTSAGCASDSCGCELQFRFWHNIWSTCNDSALSDITTQTVEVECTAGSVKVRSGGTDYPLNAGGVHTFDSIGFESATSNVETSTAGNCFSVLATSAEATFTVTATLSWDNETDHDLYGKIACGACA